MHESACASKCARTNPRAHRSDREELHGEDCSKSLILHSVYAMKSTKASRAQNPPSSRPQLCTIDFVHRFCARIRACTVFAQEHPDKLRGKGPHWEAFQSGECEFTCMTLHMHLNYIIKHVLLTNNRNEQRENTLQFQHK